MDVMIIVKWVTDWDSLEGREPPAIITLMVNMILKGGNLEAGANAGVETPLFSDG